MFYIEFKDNVSNIPSAYSGGKYRTIADRALPHDGCSRLLHIPVNVRYRVSSHLTGLRKVGQISLMAVLLVSILGSA